MLTVIVYSEINKHYMKCDNCGYKKEGTYTVTYTWTLCEECYKRLQIMRELAE